LQKNKRRKNHVTQTDEKRYEKLPGKDLIYSIIITIFSVTSALALVDYEKTSGVRAMDRTNGL
jgi:hypothetical protein